MIAHCNPTTSPKQLAPKGQVASSKEHEILVHHDEEFIFYQNGVARQEPVLSQAEDSANTRLRAR